VRPPETTAALADLGAVGPFFAVGTEPGARAGGVWRPLGALYTDPEPLRRRIAEVRRLLHSDEDRVAASLTFQSLAARIVAPPLAIAALYGIVAPLEPRALYWRPVQSGPWPMWTAVGGSPWPDVAPSELGERLAELVVDRHLRPLVDAVRARVPVAESLLWGNAASSLAAAARLVAQQRPTRSAQARACADAVLSHGPLADAWTTGPGGKFRRRSCCLYYRTPDGGLCGDCVFDEPPAVHGG
jgi:ferric iron reductase protein FhuF